MLDESPSICSLIILAVLSVVRAVATISRGRLTAPAAFRPLWVLFLVLAVSEWISFPAALWILAITSFCSLREYFSLVDIRLEDRWGILASYFSIPFMFYLIQLEWYGFFIIAIPVYAFLLIPFSLLVYIPYDYTHGQKHSWLLSHQQAYEQYHWTKKHVVSE